MNKYGISVREIGKGTFGTVTLHNYNNTRFAVKTVHDIEACRREKQICEFLSIHRHPNIIQVIEVFYESNKLVIVMEYVTKSLHDVILRMNNDNKRLKEIYTTKILRDLASGLDFLHTHGIIHRDIKPSNVLVNLQTYVTKICDFGTSKFLEAVNTSYVCTRFYRAPEQILDCLYTFSADMWSYGCIACEISIGSPFFIGENNVSQLCQIIKKIGTFSNDELQRIPGCTATLNAIPHVPQRSWCTMFTVHHGQKCVNASFGSSFEDFVSKILKWVPNERMTARECLRHSFLLQC